jgi:hypothetical protein
LDTHCGDDTIGHKRRSVLRDTIARMASQTVPLMESKILLAYADKTPRSRALHERAKALLPNGVTHVGRYLEPHPIYVERAAGSRKWDVDGNEYVDYFGGHGALILGRTRGARDCSRCWESRLH